MMSGMMFGDLISGIFIFCMVAFWVWMMADCLSNKSLSTIEKALWFFLIFFTDIVGAAIYFFFGRAKKTMVNPGFQAYTGQESQPAQTPSYEQGYQAQQQRSEERPVTLPNEDEQPHTTYPEQLQQDMR